MLHDTHVSHSDYLAAAGLDVAVRAAVVKVLHDRPTNPVQALAANLLTRGEAAGEPPNASATTATEWTAAGWLASAHVERTLAAALLGGEASGDELAAMRGLGACDSLEEELTARLVGAIGPLVAQLAPRLRELATVEAATTAEMQTKFSQEARGMLQYSSLSAFFGGLERLVGSPDPNIKVRMADEHAARGDSSRPFTTGNYGVTTTSATEWAFVATPDAPPAAGWPTEEKIRAALAGDGGADLAALLASGAQHRQPRPLAELEAATEHNANERLRELVEPQVSMEEAIGLRLYTGPLFVKCARAVRLAHNRDRCRC